MNKRLLTEDEVWDADFWKESSGIPSIEERFKNVCKAQDAKTLKEVGEYLEKTLHPAQKYGMYKDLIEALKKGKL